MDFLDKIPDLLETLPSVHDAGTLRASQLPAFGRGGSTSSSKVTATVDECQASPPSNEEADGGDQEDEVIREVDEDGNEVTTDDAVPHEIPADDEVEEDECNAASDAQPPGKVDGHSNRENTAAMMRAQLDQPVYEGCKMTLRKAVSLFLHIVQSARTSRSTVNMLLFFVFILLPQGSVFPQSAHLLDRIASKGSWQQFEHHVCAHLACEGHVWDWLDQRDWQAHINDKCPKCGRARFRVEGSSSKRKLTPVYWYLDFRVEDVISKDFFRCPEWLRAWGRAACDVGRQGSY